MKTDGIFGVADRLGRRRKQGEVRRRAVENGAEFVRGKSPSPGMNGSSELTCPISLNGAALGARAQHIERDVGIAAQAVARRAVDHRFATSWVTTLRPRASR